MAYINGREVLFSANININPRPQEGVGTANGEYFPDTGFAFSKFNVNVPTGGGVAAETYGGEYEVIE